MIWLPVRTLANSCEKLESGFEQQWLMRPLARWYQNNVSHELAKYGKSIFLTSASRSPHVPHA